MISCSGTEVPLNLTDLVLPDGGVGGAEVVIKIPLIF